MKTLRILPLSAALLLGGSCLVLAQTSGAGGTGSTTGAGIGATGLTGSNAAVVGSPSSTRSTSGIGTSPSSSTAPGSSSSGSAIPGTTGTGSTVPGTGTTGPGAAASAGGGAGGSAIEPCPPGTLPEGLGPNRRCRPISGAGGATTTGIAAPPSIMADPVAPGGSAR